MHIERRRAFIAPRDGDYWGPPTTVDGRFLFSTLPIDLQEKLNRNRAHFSSTINGTRNDEDSQNPVAAFRRWEAASAYINTIVESHRRLDISDLDDLNLMLRDRGDLIRSYESLLSQIDEFMKAKQWDEAARLKDRVESFAGIRTLYKRFKLGAGRIHCGRRIKGFYLYPHQAKEHLPLVVKLLYSELPPVLKAAKVYQDFVTVHPYTNANGREGRLLMDGVLMMQGYPPPFIGDEDFSVANFHDVVDGSNVHNPAGEEYIYSLCHVVEAVVKGVKDAAALIQSTVPYHLPEILLPSKDEIDALTLRPYKLAT